MNFKNKSDIINNNPKSIKNIEDSFLEMIDSSKNIDSSRKLDNKGTVDVGECHSKRSRFSNS